MSGMAVVAASVAVAAMAVVAQTSSSTPFWYSRRALGISGNGDNTSYVHLSDLYDTIETVGRRLDDAEKTFNARPVLKVPDDKKTMDAHKKEVEQFKKGKVVAYGGRVHLRQFALGRPFVRDWVGYVHEWK